MRSRFTDLKSALRAASTVACVIRALQAIHRPLNVWPKSCTDRHPVKPSRPSSATLLAMDRGHLDRELAIFAEREAFGQHRHQARQFPFVGNVACRRRSAVARFRASRSAARRRGRFALR
jgi:hypothetical protein